MDGDSSRRIRTRCNGTYSQAADARAYFHAFGRSGRLAGKCCADLRDQPSLFIRMYRCDMFGHFDKSGEPKKTVCVVGSRGSRYIVRQARAFWLGKLSLKR